MNFSRPHVVAALAGATALVPALALADQAPDGTVRAVPNPAGSGSTLKLDAKGSNAALKPGETPSKVTLSLTRGFSFDGRAVKSRCTDDQAKANKCPESSRSGRGTAEYHLNTGQHGTAVIGEYLAPRSHGALGDVQFVLHDNMTSQNFASHGRLVRVSGGGPYGSELRLDFPPLPLPEGVHITVDRLTLQTGAHRTVTVHVGPHHAARHRTYRLIRNPSHCPASHRWPVKLTANYASGDVTRTADVICRARAH
jgi:hypothetical protein